MQDRYISRLGEEVEQLEGVLGQYQLQAQSMDQGTVETMENVRRAEKEIKSVKAEESKMVTNWTNTVININKERSNGISSITNVSNTFWFKFRFGQVTKEKDRVCVQCRYQYHRPSVPFFLHCREPSERTI